MVTSVVGVSRAMIRSDRSRCRGLTLVEVLAVIAIIGLLMALLMPAMNQARELGRKAACNNNLRHIGSASALHLERHGTFPSGGFSTAEASNLIRPAAGFAERQPGNWTYNLLPFIELEDLHARSETTAGFNTISSVCPPAYMCPTTRHALTPDATSYSGNGGTPDAPPPATPFHLRYPKLETRDLAGNYIKLHDIVTFPADQQEILRQQTSGYPHAVPGLPYSPIGDWGPITGVIAPFGRVRAAHVTDGMSSTFLVGERNEDGCGATAWTAGFGWTSVKFTSGAYPPASTYAAGSGCVQTFGSMHVETFGMVMCDGSVRQVEYLVDMGVFSALGSRNKADLVSAGQ